MGALINLHILVEPISKLIDVFSSAFGKIYEPFHIRRMTKAKSEEIRIIAERIRENIDVPITYNKSADVSIDTSSSEELRKRAGDRFVYQEIKKQQNIEAVADKTYDLLKNSEKVSSEPVNQDWMTRFFNSIEDISNEEMQNIWAKILAGEIKKPNTYSLRMLETIKNLTSYEAKLFQEISQYFIVTGNAIFLPNEKEFLKSYQINYSTILKLDECGLISSQALLLSLNYELDKLPEKNTIAHNSKIMIRVGDNGSQKISIVVYLLSAVGKELYLTIHKKDTDNEKFIIDYAKKLQKKHKNQKISAHKVNDITNNQINYQLQDILLTAEKADKNIPSKN
ncbi:MAG: DUF2806 domain-containing protein [Fusobacteriaceae bacterium]|jgi:hypothetical protein|nr:DUF2806 domain-containing protein [Fusobacteriaceae bacterium]